MAASVAVEQAMGIDADATTAEGVMNFGLPWDLLISNLGVQDLHSAGPIRPTALWGPVLLSQVANDIVIGITTFDGVMRMVACGYVPTTEFIEAVATMLRQTAE
jgi:hypothetical protein